MRSISFLPTINKSPSSHISSARPSPRFFFFFGSPRHPTEASRSKARKQKETMRPGSFFRSLFGKKSSTTTDTTRSSTLDRMTESEGLPQISTSNEQAQEETGTASTTSRSRHRPKDKLGSRQPTSAAEERIAASEPQPMPSLYRSPPPRPRAPTPTSLRPIEPLVEEDSKPESEVRNPEYGFPNAASRGSSPPSFRRTVAWWDEVTDPAVWSSEGQNSGHGLRYDRAEVWWKADPESGAWCLHPRHPIRSRLPTRTSSTATRSSLRHLVSVRVISPIMWLWRYEWGNEISITSQVRK